MQIPKMQKRQLLLLIGRKLLSMIKWLLHILSVTAILILMIPLFALLGSLTGITLAFFYAIATTCFIRGYMKDAVMSKVKEIEDSIYGRVFTIKVL